MTRASDTARLVSGGAVFNEASNDVDFRVEGNGNANMLFVDGGNDAVVIGHNDATNGSFLSGGALQVVGTAATSAHVGISRFSDNAFPPSLFFAKSRASSIGTDTVVQDDDELGQIGFAGADGTDMSTQGATIKAAVDGTPGSNDLPTRLVFSTTADGNSSVTERMRIDSSGLVLIGNTVFNNSDNAIALHSNAGSTGHNIQLNRGSTDTKNQIAFSNPNGQVGTIQTAGSGTSYNTSSDYRLKENVVTDWDATTRLKQLKPSRFNFIADADTTVDGFLAHEVSSIVPEAISGEKDAVDADGNPEYQGIDQSKLVPLLTKALQEAMARIDTLEAEVAKLKG
jgi:hypothetical protein